MVILSNFNYNYDIAPLTDKSMGFDPNANNLAAKPSLAAKAEQFYHPIVKLPKLRLTQLIASSQLA